MDHINIVDDKKNYRTQISVVLLCEENPPVKTQVNRTIVNEVLHDTMDPDSILDHIADNMVEVMIRSDHFAGCQSCPDRAKPLMNMVKNAIKDKSYGGYYTYCVVKEIFPAFRYAVGNYPEVSNLGFERYQVRVRRFEMVLDTNTAQDSLAGLAKQLPGVEATVKYPCKCRYGISMNEGVHGGDTVMDVVIHLNDKHQWTREAIADWLTEIDDPYGDGPDLAFKVPE